MLGVCRAGLLHAPVVQTYVSAVPSVLTHSRVAIPAAIPTTVSEVITRFLTTKITIERFVNLIVKLFSLIQCPNGSGT